MTMLLLTPLFHAIAGVYFSHAWYGATRHAMAVGFISMMIVGMASRIGPRLRGVDGPHLPALMPVFVLLNLGCAIRVFAQPLTEFTAAIYPLVTASGLLELARRVWAAEMVRVLRCPNPARRHRPPRAGRSRFRSWPVDLSQARGARR